MKKKLLFALPMFLMVSCSSTAVEQELKQFVPYVSHEAELPTLHLSETSTHATYLMLSQWGRVDVNGTPTEGGKWEEAWAHNCFKLLADPGSALPTATSTVANVTFDGWAVYNDNIYPDYVTTVPAEKGTKLYAIFSGPLGGGGSGGGGGGGDTGETVVFTVTSLPDWIGNDNAAIFAWCWGGNAGGGKWYSITLSNATTGTFNAPSDITGFNMARCAAGTTNPDWTVTGDNPGRVYNKTDNVNFQSGVRSYTSPAWSEYSYQP